MPIQLSKRVHITMSNIHNILKKHIAICIKNINLSTTSSSLFEGF